MTRTSRRTLVVKTNEDGGKEANNPYAVPNSGLFLAYWHYKKALEDDRDQWNVSHDRLESKDESKPEDTKNFLKDLGKSSTSSFSRSQYVRDMRLLSKWRLIVGQKRDSCILLDQQFDIEEKSYQRFKREYKECVSALEKFLGEDHDESMRLLKESNEEFGRTAELTNRRNELSRRYGEIRLQIYHWEEAWHTVKACHRFLHRVSPLGCLDDDCLSDIEDAEEEANDNQTKFGSTCSDFNNTTSLHSLIEVFEKEAVALSKSGAKNPRDLGLVEAGDLLRLFRAIELQNLNALIHLESFGGPMADMIARIDVAETRVKYEIDDVLEGIKHLEASIVREERRADRLERRSNRLIRNSFRSHICSEKALQTRVLVEDAYESCVAVNEAGLDALSMARALENLYERLSADLDGLPRSLVAACERDGFRQELKATREAEDAVKKFELMNRLLTALRRVLEPTERKRRVLMRRSVPISNRTKRNVKKIDTAKPPGKLRQTIHLELFQKLCKLDESDGDMPDEDQN